MICYQIRNKLTGDAYIGITRFSLAERWRRHKGNARNGYKSHFHRAIRKYGWDNFELSVLYEGVAWNELCAVERGIIAERAPKYNSSYGGEGGGLWTPERRALKSQQARKQWESKDLRKRTSERAKKFWQDPEYRAKCSPSRNNRGIYQRSVEHG